MSSIFANVGFSKSALTNFAQFSERKDVHPGEHSYLIKLKGTYGWLMYWFIFVDYYSEYCLDTIMSQRYELSETMISFFISLLKKGINVMKIWFFILEANVELWLMNTGNYYFKLQVLDHPSSQKYDGGVLDLCTPYITDLTS